MFSVEGFRQQLLHAGRTIYASGHRTPPTQPRTNSALGFWHELFACHSRAVSRAVAPEPAEEAPLPDNVIPFPVQRRVMSRGKPRVG